MNELRETHLLASTRAGDPTRSHFWVQIVNPRSINRDTKKNVWLVLEWVTPIGSHFPGQIPNSRSINRETKKKYFG